MRMRLPQLVGCLLLGCAAVLLIAGCKTLAQIAPPADDRLVSTGVAPLPVLERGRTIYLTKCTTCHVAEPVHNYNAKQWAVILPEMNIETNLNPTQAAEVKAYIDACLAAGPPGPVNP